MPKALFDTNVVERRYLLPLLRGEEINDFLLLESMEPPVTPAICIKSIYEILMHAKLGGKRLPWMAPEVGYPSLTLNDWQSKHPEWDVVHMFYRSEEWHDIDWDEYLEKGREIVIKDQHEELFESSKALREFTEWKWSVLCFCKKIRQCIEDRMYVFDRHSAYGSTLYDINRVIHLEEDLADNALVPSEDLEIVVTALLNDCVAMITDDDKVLKNAGRTINDNYKTAFVRSDQLRTAVELDFGFRLFS